MQSDQLLSQLSTIRVVAVTLAPTKRNLSYRSYWKLLWSIWVSIISHHVLVQDFCKSQVHCNKYFEVETLKKWKTGGRLNQWEVCDHRSMLLHQRQLWDTLSAFWNLQFICHWIHSSLHLMEVMPVGKLSSFIVAKMHVSPTKEQTISRLELLSVLLLARLMKNVIQYHYVIWYNVTDCLAPGIKSEALRYFTDLQDR